MLPCFFLAHPNATGGGTLLLVVEPNRMNDRSREIHAALSSAVKTETQASARNNNAAAPISETKPLQPQGSCWRANHQSSPPYGKPQASGFTTALINARKGV